MTSARRRISRIGIAAALAYAALKAAWGLGSTVGISDVAAFGRFVDRFGALGWMATWGTVVLALLAAALLSSRRASSTATTPAWRRGSSCSRTGPSPSWRWRSPRRPGTPPAPAARA